ncbi:MAG: alpha-amylase family glycosyl hydrolase [Deltaproteobacteria bacterium]
MKTVIKLAFLLFLFFIVACDKSEEPSVNNNISGYTQYGTPLKEVPPTDSITMYEVNLRAFSQSGDINGIINRLDELKSVGINTLWLMPVFTQGIEKSVNSPYCIRNFKAISPEYGTLADLRKLTTMAHEKNMAVILDWVANHTSWDNIWIKNKAWYTQDANGNIIQPPGTNWADVADLNFGNTKMRDTMIDAMKYWILEANVDGYRCDYADGVPFDFWKQALDSLKNIRNRKLILLAEGSRKDHYQAGFELTYGWDFYGKLKSVWKGENAQNLIAAHNSEYSGIPTGKHKLRFTTNHDESAWDASPMTLFNGKNGALAASAAAIFLGGVPLIYTGQEVGKTGTTPFFSKSPIDWTSNQDMLAEYKRMMEIYHQLKISSKRSLSNYSGQDILAFKRYDGNNEVLFLINSRNKVISFTMPDPLKNTSWKNLKNGQSTNLGNMISLNPYDYMIYSKF